MDFKKMIDNRKIVLMGEALFDCFPEGRRVAGGAPFNVTWNLFGLGEDPLFISAVGMDQMGDELLEIMKKWGLNTNMIMRLSEVKTSVVEVCLTDGNPDYEICKNTAFDHLKLPDYVLEGNRNDILYHGSLATRSACSYETISRFRKQWKGKVFVDINIRQPWFDQTRFEDFIRGIDYLKINDLEYEELTGMSYSWVDPLPGIISFVECYDIANLIVTCGSKGSFWYDGNELHSQSANTEIPIVDTVGAGDAFASVCLKGIQESWEISTILKFANALAERVCGIKGATLPEPSFFLKP